MMDRGDIYQLLLQNQGILPVWLCSEMDHFSDKDNEINCDVESKVVTESYVNFLLEKSNNLMVADERISEYKARYKALSSNINKNVTYIMIYNTTHNFSFIVDNYSKNVIYYATNW